MGHEPIPIREDITEKNRKMTNIWHQFLYKIFGKIFERLDDLEQRVSELENP